MHQLYHADEVRPVSEIPAPEAAAKPAELKLARELVARLTTDRFAPERYEDEVRKRIRALIERKVAGGEIRTAPEGRAPGKVIDLMEALKASLAAGQAEKEKQARTRGRRSGTLRKAG
jgi:DNA end-binding protein Ku